MNHETHVGFVDTHAEGDGGHDHVHLFHQEGVLVAGAGDGIHAGMVGQRLDAIDIEQFGDLLHLAAAQAIDDAALAGVLLDVADDIALGIGFVADFVVEIRAVEGGLEDLRIRHPQVFLDVRLHLGRGRGGEGDDGRTADILHDLADAAVLRAEVVSPFGNTVCLVDRVEGDLQLLEESNVLLFGQRLRRDVEQLGAAGEKVVLHILDLRLVERGVQEVGDTLVPVGKAADGV